MNGVTSQNHLQLASNESVPIFTLIFERTITDHRVRKAIGYMREDLTRRMSLASLAEHAKISPRQLSRLFQSETKYSPIHYLHLLRLEEACFLLGSSEYQVKEICHQVGLEDECNFDHEFKKHKGCSPREFRQKVMAMKNHGWIYQEMSISTK